LLGKISRKHYFALYGELAEEEYVDLSQDRLHDSDDDDVLPMLSHLGAK
jgi:hypothetical protein